MKRIVAAAIALLAAACGDASEKGQKPDAAAASDAQVAIVGVDELAERFVKLGLALGEHDPAYVDAYSGPEEWAAAAKTEKRSLADLETDADEIIEALDVLNDREASARAKGLERAAIAAKTRIRMARGEKFPFNEEAKLLYGAAPGDYSLAEFDAALADVDAIFPGEGDLTGRVNVFKDSLKIPVEKRRAVIDAAIAECRARTMAHMALPDGENFELSFVTEKPWGAYNWYQGDFKSKIEVNTDQPVMVSQAVEYGCHEGYPGHHVWNLLVERDLRRKNKWIEFSILPLFGPGGLLGEGSANYGVKLAFPGEEKLKFEREVLYPLAGIDPDKADLSNRLGKAAERLSHSSNYIAREYLEGRIDGPTAVNLTMKYGLTTRDRAERLVRFIDAYRSYVINYNLGKDLVEAYIDRRKAEGADAWAAFEELLTNPDPASALVPA
jgi:hypothetical protein